MRKKITCITAFFSLLLLMSAQGQEKETKASPPKPSYTKKFKYDTVPGTYKVISLTRNALILLKRFEPLTKKRILALTYFRILSRHQVEDLQKYLGKDHTIQIPNLEKILAENKFPMKKIIEIVSIHQGPYTEIVQDQLQNLGVLTEAESKVFNKILDANKYLPEIPPEEPVIVMETEWKGVPLDQRGRIDTNALFLKMQTGTKAELEKLQQKHLVLEEEIVELYREKIKSKSQKSYAKGLEKRRKKALKIMEKVWDLEKKISDQKSLEAYLYLLKTYNSRYFVRISDILNENVDKGNLLFSIIKKPTDLKGKQYRLISPEDCQFQQLEKFIAIDKALLWMANPAQREHKSFSVEILKILLDQFPHPPWEAPDEMWDKWWKMEQRNIYTSLVKKN